MKIKFKKLHEAAQAPKLATVGAACFDLVAIEGGQVPEGWSHTFRTGLAIEVPEGFALMIYSRSGHGFKSGVRLSNSVGVIDSDYRGEIHVRLANDGADHFTVNAGERIAQAMLVEVPRVELVDVLDGELSATERGAGGFGSTGH